MVPRKCVQEGRTCVPHTRYGSIQAATPAAECRAHLPGMGQSLLGLFSNLVMHRFPPPPLARPGGPRQPVAPREACGHMSSLGWRADQHHLRNASTVAECSLLSPLMARLPYCDLLRSVSSSPSLSRPASNLRRQATGSDGAGAAGDSAFPALRGRIAPTGRRYSCYPERQPHGSSYFVSLLGIGTPEPLPLWTRSRVVFGQVRVAIYSHILWAMRILMHVLAQTDILASRWA